MKRIIGIFIFLSIFELSFSQTEIKKSDETAIINNQKYYLHKVEAGQTLYSICKAYNVSQKDVAKANNILTSSIKIGQILKMPIVNKEEKDSPDFIFHKVTAGETLYALSKKYNVSVEDIIMHNVDAKYGIKTDQVLKIPNIKKGNFDYEDENIYYYTVEKGNTLFSISQKFGMPIRQIVLFNPETKNGLKAGQTLKIPKTNYDISERLPINNDTEIQIYEHLYFEEEGITPCNKFVYNKTMSFNIVLLLPLHLDRNVYYISNYKDEKDKMFYKNTKVFFELYEGILLALQTLKKQGLSINLSVYDTKNDSKTVNDIMKSLNYNDVDLIIGPVYSANVKIATNYAKNNRINLISPLSQNIDLIKNNPFVYQVVPSTEMRIKKTSDMFGRMHDTSIVMIHNGTEKEKKLINIYKNKLVQSSSFQETTNAISLKTVNYNKGGEETIEDALSVGVQNVIVIPSDEEVFITQVVDKLNLLSETYDIKLVGSPNWESFQNINLKHLKDLSFHYISPVFRNYSNPEVKKFVAEYRTTFETEPSIYSFEGYDIMYYFANALRKYGRHFQFCLSPGDAIPDKNGIVFDFDFVRTNKNGGFENNGMFILEYSENFQKQKTTF
ncbi:MAG: LysM peptidoglycan-binding domain-containing protein [Bacteroidales bacterium]|nr:LysM peptidoglycan-binding domain-containing protein [Bacteroidales bacterium]